MKLILKEYLSIIREEGELDSLLPALLFNMNYRVLSKPQKGVRQYGVDVAAVGEDLDKSKKLFLFVIKQGDIGRTDWDGSNQAIRPSLNEIIDVYLQKYVNKKYQHFVKKIIVCTGGNLKQEAENNWNGYIETYSGNDQIEFDLWDGDVLSKLCEKYIFNEEIVPNEYKSYLRKTLVLLDDSDYNLEDFYKLLSLILLERKSKLKKKTLSKRKIKRIFSLVNLSLNIVYSWSITNNNLKPALLCAERTLLYTWEFIRANDLTKDKSTLILFLKIYNTFRIIYNDYFMKVYNNSFVLDGFCVNGVHSTIENLSVYEQLGILSNYGNMVLLEAISGVIQKDTETRLNSIKLTLISFIKNHKILNSPFYDNHIIELSVTIYFLVNMGERNFIKNWIEEIIISIEFAYITLGKNFPIDSDFFEDLISVNITGEIKKEELMKISTLIPILAQWCIVLGFDDTYDQIRQKVNKSFLACTLQIWYPDAKTIDYIFLENAANKSGAMDAPYLLEESIDVMKEKMKKVQKNTIDFEGLTPSIEGGAILPFISNRHYRTPFLPIFWQMGFYSKEKNKNKK